MVSNSGIDLGLGEKLLWQGKPGTDFRFQMSDFTAIPFGIFFLCFAIFWTSTALDVTANMPAKLGTVSPRMVGFFPFFGLFFIAGGIYMVFGRLIVDSMSRKRTEYFLTDKRIVVVKNWISRRVQSIYWRSVVSIECSEQSNGTGTIKFIENATSRNPFGMSFAATSPYGSNAMEFVMIPEVKAVNAIVTKQMQDKP